jgi:hypothetical protein
MYHVPGYSHAAAALAWPSTLSRVVPSQGVGFAAAWPMHSTASDQRRATCCENETHSQASLYLFH